MELTTIALAIACALVVLSIVMLHGRRGRLYEQASKFEGPTTLPLIGNALLLRGGNEVILKSIAKFTKSYPSPYQFWIGHRLFLAVADPEQLKTILSSTKTVEKSWMYKFLKPSFGGGLITADSSIWRVHRKLIQPTFNSKLLNSFVDVFATHSKILADKLERNLDGPEFEVYDLMALTAMHTLCETVMGLEIGAQNNGAHSGFINALQKVMALTTTRIFNIWLHPDFIFNRSRTGREFWRNVKIMRDFTNTVIEHQKSKLPMKRCSGQSDIANTEDDESIFIDEQMPSKEPFLVSVLKLTREGDQWSDEEICEEVNTMMVAVSTYYVPYLDYSWTVNAGDTNLKLAQLVTAERMGGGDTTAITNCFIMLMLASHPDIQEKVYQELYEIYGDADIDERPVTQEDLGRMEYLERVIKETTRLFPLIPVIARKMTEDLEIGEHTLPKGSEVVIPVLEVHRNEKYWPDPYKFDPDRFLAEEIAKRNPYTYLAFSAGPRNCIGIKYAMMAMKTLHATILRRFVLKKDNIVKMEDIRVKMETALKMVEPLTLRIEKRTQN